MLASEHEFSRTRKRAPNLVLGPTARHVRRRRGGGSQRGSPGSPAHAAGDTQGAIGVRGVELFDGGMTLQECRLILLDAEEK